MSIMSTLVPITSLTSKHRIWKTSIPRDTWIEYGASSLQTCVATVDLQASKCKVFPLHDQNATCFLSDSVLDIPSVPAVDSLMDDPNADEDLIPTDTRRVTRLLDSMVQAEGELSDSDDEGLGGRRNTASARDTEEPATTDSAAAMSEEETGQPVSESVVVIATAKAPTGILAASDTQGAGPSGSGVVVHEAPMPTNDSAKATNPDDIPMDIDIPSALPALADAPVSTVTTEAASTPIPSS
jgi:hypothetical protein